MATKNISITEQAYRRLVRLRLSRDESFSKVILRATRYVDLRRYIGVLSEESARHLETQIKRERMERLALRRRRLAHNGLS